MTHRVFRCSDICLIPQGPNLPPRLNVKLTNPAARRDIDVGPSGRVITSAIVMIDFTHGVAFTQSGSIYVFKPGASPKS